MKKSDPILKGGEEEMEKKQSQVFVEKCSYCNKEFPETLYEAQAISWKKSHEDYCPKNPSNKRK